MQFPEGFTESHLWVDPFASIYAGYCGAVLRAEQIKRYVNLNLLIDKGDFIEKNLKGASYSMSPAPDQGWIVEDHQIVRLKTASDPKGEYYIVPRNSLVYIKLREWLRLPFYIIGRHNLKIDYVYQGLLLGTGPQVDPGYMGKLYIPLHNLRSTG